MTSLTTSGRPHDRHLDFYVTSSLSETVMPNITKLAGFKKFLALGCYHKRPFGPVNELGADFFLELPDGLAGS